MDRRRCPVRIRADLLPRNFPAWVGSGALMHSAVNLEDRKIEFPEIEFPALWKSANSKVWKRCGCSEMSFGRTNPKEAGRRLTGRIKKKSKRDENERPSILLSISSPDPQVPHNETVDCDRSERSERFGWSEWFGCGVSRGGSRGGPGQPNPPLIQSQRPCSGPSSFQLEPSPAPKPTSSSSNKESESSLDSFSYVWLVS